MSDLEKAAGLLAALGARLHEVAGQCEAHGPSTVLARTGLAWYCPGCLEANKRAEYDQQWAAARRADLHAIAEIPTKYRGQKFVAATPAQTAVRAIAVSFRDFVIAQPRWACLILLGDVGTGKTQLACELAESCINKFARSVRYVTAKGMIAEIQASYGAEGKSEASEIARFVQYDILILDEIELIPDKDNAKLLLNEIINQRYGNDKPLVAITNQPLANLAKFVGTRVHDRLHENGYVCQFTWPSFRKIT